MLNARVLSVSQKKKIYDRLREATPGLTRSDIVAKLKEIGFDLTVKSLSTYSAGKAAPNADTLFAMSEAFGVSVDWLLTGKKPEPLTPEQFRKLVDDFVLHKGLELRDLHPDVQWLIDSLDKASNEKRLEVIEIAKIILQKGSVT